MRFRSRLRLHLVGVSCNFICWSCWSGDSCYGAFNCPAVIIHSRRSINCVSSISPAPYVSQPLMLISCLHDPLLSNHQQSRPPHRHTAPDRFIEYYYIPLPPETSKDTYAIKLASPEARFITVQKQKTVASSHSLLLLLTRCHHQLRAHILM